MALEASPDSPSAPTPSSSEQNAPHPGPLHFSSPRDIDEFVDTLRRYERGEMTADEFKVYRLGRGTYGQRQMDVHMLRVKIPQGVVSAEQLEVMATVAEEYSRGIGHVTTRQNFQFHFIPLARVAEALRLLDTVGLTTKEACGNTVRNITACPLAGVCDDAPFDVTAYSRATTRYFLRNPICQALPRKFKVAFSGCPDDCAQGAINDVGVIAAERTVAGPAGATAQRGFVVNVAGGLSTSPENAHRLFDFVAEDELLPVLEAVLRVFDRCGNRQNKSRARLKYVVRKLGWEGFKKEFEVELAGIRASGRGRIPFVLDAEVATPSPSPREDAIAPRAGYAAFRSTNVIRQRQAGYFAVIVRLVRGDLTALQFRDLARLCRRFSDGTVRTSNDQNMVMRFVAEADLPALHAALEDAGLGLANARTIADVTACPGADTCNLAVTHSRELALAISDKLEHPNGAAATVDAARSLDVKISGCPNSCGQHHVAALGFHGTMRRVGGRSAPEYQLHLGGGIDRDGAVFGRQVVKIPSRRIPDAVMRLLALYQEQRHDGEAPLAFFRRVDEQAVKDAVADLARMDEATARPEDYIDIGQDSQFVVAIGAGECAT